MSSASQESESAAKADVWTVQRLLTWTTDWLARSGSPTPRLDGELLLAHVLGCSRLQLILRFDQPVQPDELAAFKALLRRRNKHEPVAYILGRKAFHDIVVDVGPSVLVPRPETETLVDFAAAFLHEERTPKGPVVDLCTGSGCIALALMRDMQKLGMALPMWATDLSYDALQMAIANAAKLGHAIEFRHGDLFEALPAGMRFALVVSNPPYVSPRDWQALEPDVRDFEPRMALDGGGDDGLAIAQRLVAQAAQHLLPGGLVALEVGSRSQALALAHMAESAGLFSPRIQQVIGSPTHLFLAYAPLPVDALTA